MTEIASTKFSWICLKLFHLILVCSILTLPCYVQYARNHLIFVESSSFYVSSLWKSFYFYFLHGIVYHLTIQYHNNTFSSLTYYLILFHYFRRH
jgi:hypothetical protein